VKNKTSVFQLGIKCCQIELNNYLACFLHDMSHTATLQQKSSVLHAALFSSRELQNF